MCVVNAELDEQDYMLPVDCVDASHLYCVVEDPLCVQHVRTTPCPSSNWLEIEVIGNLLCSLLHFAMALVSGMIRPLLCIGLLVVLFLLGGMDAGDRGRAASSHPPWTDEEIAERSAEVWADTWSTVAPAGWDANATPEQVPEVPTAAVGVGETSETSWPSSASCSSWGGDGNVPAASTPTANASAASVPLQPAASTSMATTSHEAAQQVGSGETLDAWCTSSSSCSTGMGGGYQHWSSSSWSWSHSSSSSSAGMYWQAARRWTGTNPSSGITQSDQPAEMYTSNTSWRTNLDEEISVGLQEDELQAALEEMVSAPEGEHLAPIPEDLPLPFVAAAPPAMRNATKEENGEGGEDRGEEQAIDWWELVLDRRPLRGRPREDRRDEPLVHGRDPCSLATPKFAQEQVMPSMRWTTLRPASRKEVIAFELASIDGTTPTGAFVTEVGRKTRPRTSSGTRLRSLSTIVRLQHGHRRQTLAQLGATLPRHVLRGRTAPRHPLPLSPSPVPRWGSLDTECGSPERGQLQNNVHIEEGAARGGHNDVLIGWLPTMTGRGNLHGSTAT